MTTFTINLHLADEAQLLALLRSRAEQDVTAAVSGIDVAGEPFLVYATPGSFHLITADPTGGGVVRGGPLAFPITVPIRAAEHD